MSKQMFEKTILDYIEVLDERAKQEALASEDPRVSEVRQLVHGADARTYLLVSSELSAFLKQHMEQALNEPVSPRG